VLSVPALSCKKILMPLVKLLLLSPEVPTGEWHRILADFNVRLASTLAEALRGTVQSREWTARWLPAPFRTCLSRRCWSYCSSLTPSFPSFFRKRDDRRGCSLSHPAGCISLLQRRGFSRRAAECLERAAEESAAGKRPGIAEDKREEWRRWLVGESPAMQDVENTIRLVGRAGVRY
jgi:hypothetical protein